MVPPAVLRVGEDVCPTYHDDAFAAVRSALGVPHDFLRSFDWASLRAGGGKGGTLLAFHGRFVVKELSPSDHATLLGLAGPYSTHAAFSRGSLLAPLYAHFRRPSTGVDYVAMGSVLPPLAAEVVDAAPPCLYDLKGTADDKTLMFEGDKVLDVHKRFYNIGLRCCDFLARHFHCCGRAAASAADMWAPGRREYAQGKKHAREVSFPVTPLSYAWLLDRLEVDVSFLREHGLMDYSMLVRAHRIPPLESVPPESQPAAAAAHHRVRMAAEARANDQRGGALDSPLACEVADGSVWLIDVGIIDYLQEWTLAKRVARCLKFAEVPPYKHKSTEPPPYYAKRFLAALAAKFRPVGRVPGASNQRFPSWQAAHGTQHWQRRWSPLAIVRAALAAALSWLSRFRGVEEPTDRASQSDRRARNYSQLGEARSV